MRVRVKRRAVVSLLFDFLLVLRPCDLLEASPGATRRQRENERISSTAPREIDELRAARSNEAAKREYDEEM